MDRRVFTLGLLTASALGGLGGPANAQSAASAAAYMAMANKGGNFLEETARSAFEKTGDPAVKRFARAEVLEQVSLEGKLAAAAPAAMPPGAMPPGGLVGAAVSAPFAVAGAAVAAPGALIGGVFGAPPPMTSDAQKAEMIARFRAMAGGPAFDAAFVDAQLTGHQEALGIHGSYAANGDDPALRRVARGALPLIKLHIAQLTRMQRMAGPTG